MTKKAEKDEGGLRFKVGGNLAPIEEGGEERRFEEGEKVPADLTKKQMAALRAMDAIEEKEK